MAPDITETTEVLAAQSQKEQPHTCLTAATSTIINDTASIINNNANSIRNNNIIHNRKHLQTTENENKHSTNNYYVNENDAGGDDDNDDDDDDNENHIISASAADEVSTTTTNTKFEPQIRWPDLIVQIFLHTGALYGLYLLFHAKFFTHIWVIVLILSSGFGITAGAHRLWSHRAYKAKWQLRLILVFLFSIAGQRDAYTWAHDHRVHHKYSETDSDPHDARRGFLFAHIGWLVLTPHPDVVAKRKIIDMSDLESDPIVMWQKKYYEIIFALLAIAMPVLVPWYFWNESIWLSFWICFNLRFCCTLNIAFFVNSVAHMYGNRPYDQHISPVENIAVSIAALGEGWHNYHHVFPWDYKTGELGDYTYNITTGFIDTFAKLGWAYDRKSVSQGMINRRAAKCGDGTHFLSDTESHKDAVWGLGDKDIAKEDIDELNQMHD